MSVAVKRPVGRPPKVYPKELVFQHAFWEMTEEGTAEKLGCCQELISKKYRDAFLLGQCFRNMVVPPRGKGWHYTRCKKQRDFLRFMALEYGLDVLFALANVEASLTMHERGCVALGLASWLPLYSTLS